MLGEIECVDVGIGYVVDFEVVECVYEVFVM